MRQPMLCGAKRSAVRDEVPVDEFGLAAPLVCHERPTFAGAVVDTRGLRSKHGWRVNRFKLRRVKKVVAEVVDDALVDTVIEVAKHHDEY
jgi:hypothetical protein